MNHGELENKVRALLAQGRKVEAVKQVHRETGWGLKEAKDYVDALAYAALPALGAADEAAMEQAARALIQQGRPIEAIRRVRGLTNWGLRESKDYVDGLIREDPINWASLASQVRDMLAQDMKVEAVEWVMAQAEMDVQEARDYVDLLSRPVQSSLPSEGLPAQAVSQVRALLAQGQKIEAIKLVRMLTGWGLRASKEYVDALEAGRPTSPDSVVIVPVDYGSLSTGELLAALETAGRGPEPDLIRACLERREELTPALLDMLAEGADPDWDGGDPRIFRDVHAGLLLCAFREPAALPVFDQVFRDPDREGLLEWFDQDLPAAYGPAAVPMLMDLMNDTSAREDARSSAMGMLTIIAQDHPAERERVVAELRALLPWLTDAGTLPPKTKYSELWTWVAASLADLQDEASQPQILALYKAGMIAEWIMGDRQEYLAYFRRKAKMAKEAPRSFDVLNTYEQLHRDAAEEARRRASAAKRAAAAPRPARPRTQPKVGRNAPCPCGSGRKYKHCCGKKR
jgi:ribosomal protein L7/L12